MAKIVVNRFGKFIGVRERAERKTVNSSEGIVIFYRPPIVEKAMPHLTVGQLEAYAKKYRDLKQAGLRVPEIVAVDEKRKSLFFSKINGKIIDSAGSGDHRGATNAVEKALNKVEDKTGFGTSVAHELRVLHNQNYRGHPDHAPATFFFYVSTNKGKKVTPIIGDVGNIITFNSSSPGSKELLRDLKARDTSMLLVDQLPLESAPSFIKEYFKTPDVASKQKIIKRLKTLASGAAEIQRSLRIKKPYAEQKISKIKKLLKILEK